MNVQVSVQDQANRSAYMCFIINTGGCFLEIFESFPFPELHVGVAWTWIHSAITFSN